MIFIPRSCTLYKGNIFSCLAIGRPDDFSGSGPAYVFHMIEAMTMAGVAEGLEAALALELALETVRGAGALAADSDLSPSKLRENVTSPGGTTAAALAVLMGDGRMEKLIEKAIKAAADRSRELGS